jgi:hypothetical protein
MENRQEFRERVGGVDFGDSLDFRSRGQVLRDFVFAIVLVIAIVALTFWAAWPESLSILVTLVLFTVYCGIGYLVRVRPNFDNVGLAGGVIDHPLRLSDGANRALIRLALFLALGRYISHGLADGVRLLTRGQLPHERYMQEQDKTENAPAARDS